jgi:hypothetical protein
VHEQGCKDFGHDFGSKSIEGERDTVRAWGSIRRLHDSIFPFLYSWNARCNGFWEVMAILAKYSMNTGRFKDRGDCPNGLPIGTIKPFLVNWVSDPLSFMF